MIESFISLNNNYGMRWAELTGNNYQHSELNTRDRAHNTHTTGVMDKNVADPVESAGATVSCELHATCVLGRGGEGGYNAL